MTAILILRTLGNARRDARNAAEARDRAEAELRDLDEYYMAHHHEYSQSFWQDWYARQNYLALTRRVASLREAYTAARQVEDAAERRWEDAAANLTAQQIRNLVALI